MSAIRWLGLLLFACALIGIVGCSKANFESRKEESSMNSIDATSESETPMQITYDYEIREIDCSVHEQKIYGIAYIPQTDDKVPLAIFGHELGSTHRSGIPYAEELASRGIAVYTLDFRGGSVSSQSDGSTVGMSVMTEAEDMEAVLEDAKDWEFVDSSRIVMIGASQGGMASAVAASRHGEELSGLILLYPALLVHDAVHEQFDSLDDVPEQFNFNGWIMVAKNYASDVWDYDVYSDMEDFEKPVLILHGDRDGIVDLSYSERAAETYPNADFHVLHRAGHGFYGSSFDEAMGYILEYLQRIDFLD